MFQKKFRTFLTVAKSLMDIAAMNVIMWTRGDYFMFFKCVLLYYKCVRKKKLVCLSHYIKFLAVKFNFFCKLALAFYWPFSKTWYFIWKRAWGCTKNWPRMQRTYSWKYQFTHPPTPSPRVWLYCRGAYRRAVSKPFFALRPGAWPGTFQVGSRDQILELPKGPPLSDGY